MTTLPVVSLLDDGALPIADLARIAIREGVRPRDGYQTHKWFARRFAVTARTLLVAAASDRSESFWRNFYRGNIGTGLTVLDPFVGGGTMLLESARLGASVRGVDVEPMAAAIALFQTTLRDLPDLQGPLEDLAETVGCEVAPFYRSEDADGQAETLLHAFWVQVIDCRSCGRRIEAHPRFRLAWNTTEEKQWVACSECSRVLEADLDAASVACACGAGTLTSSGRLERGNFNCPSCNARDSLISHARRTAAPPKFRMFAVETLPKGDDRRTIVRYRRLRSATAFDQSRYDDAERRLQTLLAAHPDALPTRAIPRSGRADNRLIDYGYRDYNQMFNARQRLHLALLGAAVSKVTDGERNGLAIAFSAHLTTNNMFCAYAGGWRRLAPLFAIRAYRHIARPVEINPWLENNGRGTFPNAVRAVVRASQALKNPREPSPRGLFKRTRDVFSGRTDIVCGDARRMKHIPSGSVDLVLTDPPYFDYIPYSELGDFFTPWLRRFGVIGRRRATGFPRGQIAAATRSRDSERRFARKLTEAFREIRRVCKAEGRVVFTYQNRDGRGWRALAGAMARAGLRPLRTLPLYGDGSAGLHKHARSISWDAVMVCCLGEPYPRLTVDAVDRTVGRRAADVWAGALANGRLGLTDGDRANLAEAAAIVAAFDRMLRSHSPPEVNRGPMDGDSWTP